MDENLTFILSVFAIMLALIGFILPVSNGGSIATLTDVDLTGINNGEILTYNSGLWTPTNSGFNYTGNLFLFNGTNGVNGINGTNGIDGINGTNGLDFNVTGNVFLFNGTNGINGNDGINGTNGTNGTSAIIYGSYLAFSTTTEATKTNIGTSYVAVYSGYNGKEFTFNYTGFTYWRFIVWVNKVGSGTQDWKLSSDGTNSTISVSDTGSAGEHKLDSDWSALPISGEYNLRVMGKSTTSQDDPVFRGFELLVK